MSHVQHAQNVELRMRYAIVTETYPPEINGVALTVQGLEQGLRARDHDITLVRPRQENDSVNSQSKSTPPPQPLVAPSISPALRAREPLAGNAHRAMQALHPEQVAADFDALLAGLVDSRKAYASAAIA